VKEGHLRELLNRHLDALRRLGLGGLVAAGRRVSAERGHDQHLIAASTIKAVGFTVNQGWRERKDCSSALSRNRTSGNHAGIYLKVRRHPGSIAAMSPRAAQARGAEERAIVISQ